MEVGIDGRKSIIQKKVKSRRKEHPWEALAIREWYTELTSILGHQLMLPFGAFGILAHATEEYLGNREGALRSGLSRADATSKCIDAPKQG